MVVTRPRSLFLLNPYSLLLGYKRPIPFCAMAGILGHRCLARLGKIKACNICIQIDLGLMIEPFLAGSKSFGGLSVVNDGLVVGRNTAY